MTVRTLALIGATGRTGQQVISEALSRGYSLRVLARSPQKVQAHANITVIEGDARSSESLNQLLQGADAVVSTLGPAGINLSVKQAKSAAKEMLCYNSTQTLLPLLKDHGIRRFLLTGGASLKQPGDKNGLFTNFMLTKFAPKILGDLCVDRQKEYQLLSKSDIDWTIARCGGIIDEPSSKPLRYSSNQFQGSKISKHHLACFLLDQLDDEQFYRKGVYLAS